MLLLAGAFFTAAGLTAPAVASASPAGPPGGHTQHAAALLAAAVPARGGTATHADATVATEIALSAKPALHGAKAGFRSAGGTVRGQDTFDRANGELGPQWTAMTGGGLAIVNQQVRGTNAGGDSGDIRTGEAYGNDQYSEVQVTSTRLSASQWVGPAVRAQAGGQDLYVGIYFWDNGRPKLLLFLRDNGNWTQLGATNTDPLAAGTTLTLAAVGSTLAFEENGSVVISASDNTLAGGAPAILANGTATAANWSGGNSGFQVDYQGSTNGVQTYDFFSPENGYGTQTLRVVQPTHPTAGVAHNFLFVLPVEAGLGTTYGDGLETLQALDAENSTT